MHRSLLYFAAIISLGVSAPALTPGLVTPATAAPKVTPKPPPEKPPPKLGDGGRPNNEIEGMSVFQDPNGGVKCKSGRVPCTPEQVKAIAAKSSVKTLKLASDGSLWCDGAPCTVAHLTGLKAAALKVKSLPVKGGDAAPK